MNSKNKTIIEDDDMNEEKLKYYKNSENTGISRKEYKDLKADLEILEKMINIYEKTN